MFICHEEEFIRIICTFKWTLSICRMNDKSLHWLILTSFLFRSILTFLGRIHYLSLPFIGFKVRIRFWYYTTKIHWSGNRVWKVFLIKTAKFDIDSFIRKSTSNYWDASWDVLKWKLLLLSRSFSFLKFSHKFDVL